MANDHKLILPNDVIINENILAHYQGMASTKTYHYPDGTKCSNRPKNGIKYYCIDKKSNPSKCDIWQWDDYRDCWILQADPNPVSITIPITGFGGAPITYDLSTMDETYIYDSKTGKLVIMGNNKVKESKMAKCECGSEKIGSNRHSSWCEKFT